MDRLARHLLQRNPDTLKDAELLELLLRFAVGETNAAALAQRLLERWPCLASVLEADAQELSAVEGMTDECAVLLRLVPELQRRYLIARSAPETSITMRPRCITRHRSQISYTPFRSWEINRYDSPYSRRSRAMSSSI